MSSGSGREAILNKIKDALKKSTPEPFPGLMAEEKFSRPELDLDITFAEAFTSLQGNFSFCLDFAELTSQLNLLAASKEWNKWYCNQSSIKERIEKNGWFYGWHPDLADCQVSITGCEALVARTGSMVLSSQASGGRTPSVYAPAHICIATTDQLVFDIEDAIKLMQDKYNGQLPSQISFASGPSRTADIEKTLVTGVHGPKEVYCFLVEAG